MRNFEKFVELGAAKIADHASGYEMTLNENATLCELAKISKFDAIAKAYRAGIEAGYRMATNDRKRK